MEMKVVCVAKPPIALLNLQLMDGARNSRHGWVHLGDRLLSVGWRGGIKERMSANWSPCLVLQLMWGRLLSLSGFSLPNDQKYKIATHWPVFSKSSVRLSEGFWKMGEFM